MPKASRGLKPKTKISKLRWGIFVLVFAIGGGALLWLSFAAPNPNLPGDLNNDNTVDATDLSILLTNYSTTNSVADINGDGQVNVVDLSILLSHYGQTYSSGGTTATLPTAPSSYIVPGGATLVSTSAQLTSALSSGVANIELADGTYANSTYFTDSKGSNIYAQHLGGAVLSAGLVVGGGSGSGGATIQGLAFNMTNSSLGFQGAELNIWGAAGANTKVYDSTFEGNYDLSYGIYNLEVAGMDAQRLTFSHFLGDAFAVYNNDAVAYSGTNSGTPVISNISDIAIDGVHASTPGSSNGTAEAGLWVGNPVTNGVHRVSVKNVYWSGIWTGNDSWNTTFSDLTVDESGMAEGVAIYIEHFTYHDIFTNLNITGANVGVNSEWDDGTTGNAAGHFNTIENGTINASGSTNDSGGGHDAGVFLDQGTESTTVTNVTFKNQNWAGIGAYNSTGTNNFSNNTYQLKAGAVNTTTNHI